MLQHDINFERTCSLEDGKRWKRENRRRAAINIFCYENKNAMIIWKHYFINHNDSARRMLKMLTDAKVPITDGIIEAVISNV